MSLRKHVQTGSFLGRDAGTSGVGSVGMGTPGFGRPRFSSVPCPWFRLRFRGLLCQLVHVLLDLMKLVGRTQLGAGLDRECQSTERLGDVIILGETSVRLFGRVDELDQVASGTQIVFVPGLDVVVELLSELGINPLISDLIEEGVLLTDRQVQFVAIGKQSRVLLLSVVVGKPVAKSRQGVDPLADGRELGSHLADLGGEILYHLLLIPGRSQRGLLDSSVLPLPSERLDLEPFLLDLGLGSQDEKRARLLQSVLAEDLLGRNLAGTSSYGTRGRQNKKRHPAAPRDLFHGLFSRGDSRAMVLSAEGSPPCIVGQGPELSSGSRGSRHAGHDEIMVRRLLGVEWHDVTGSCPERWRRGQWAGLRPHLNSGSSSRSTSNVREPSRLSSQDSPTKCRRCRIQGEWSRPCLLAGLLRGAAMTYDHQSAFEVRSTSGRRPRRPFKVVVAVVLLVIPSGARPDEKGQPAETSGRLVLFDGTSLEGWKKTDFYKMGEVKVERGTIVMSAGGSMTGITSTRKDLPETNYQLSYEAMRLTGQDFFGAATFPVGKSFITLVNGGWGGGITGLSSLDGMDASENDTSRSFRYQNNTWYRFRVRVTDAMIRAWIDDKEIVAVKHQNRRVSTRIETRRNQPLGFATWETSGALRKIEIRRLTPTEVAETDRFEE